jgi:hypothetical protein
MSNFISATLSEADQKRALELIAELKKLFGFGIKLSSEQKKTMTKVDDVRLPFVEKGIQFGKQEPKIVPPFTDLEEYSRDLELYKSLQSIDRELTSLAEMVTDTRTAAGTDAFQAALSIYNSAKGAVKMGIPGTQSMVDQMSKLFSNQGVNKKVKDEKTV